MIKRSAHQKHYVLSYSIIIVSMLCIVATNLSIDTGDSMLIWGPLLIAFYFLIEINLSYRRLVKKITEIESAEQP